MIDLFGKPGGGTTTVVKVVDRKAAGKDIDWWYSYGHRAYKLIMEAMKEIEALKAERDEYHSKYVEMRAIDAGLRAVIRFYLHTIRDIKPNSDLIDKKTRDQIFNNVRKKFIAEFHKQNPDIAQWSTRLKDLETGDPSLSQDEFVRNVFVMPSLSKSVPVDRLRKNVRTNFLPNDK